MYWKTHIIRDTFIKHVPYMGISKHEWIQKNIYSSLYALIYYHYNCVSLYKGKSITFNILFLTD